MKFGIVCDVDSKILMGTGVTLPGERKNYIFYTHHETFFLKQVRIISQVGDASVYSLLKEGTTTSWSYEESLKQES